MTLAYVLFSFSGKAGKQVRLIRILRIIRVFKLFRHFIGLQSLIYTLKQVETFFLISHFSLD